MRGRGGGEGRDGGGETGGWVGGFSTGISGGRCTRFRHSSRLPHSRPPLLAAFFFGRSPVPQQLAIHPIVNTTVTSSSESSVRLPRRPAITSSKTIKTQSEQLKKNQNTLTTATLRRLPVDRGYREKSTHAVGSAESACWNRTNSSENEQRRRRHGARDTHRHRHRHRQQASVGFRSRQPDTTV